MVIGGDVVEAKEDVDADADAIENDWPERRHGHTVLVTKTVEVDTTS